MAIHIETPFTKEKVQKLKAGDTVLLSGIIYTGRDAAHKRLVDQIKNNEKLPFDIKDNIIYYVGPAPAKKGEVIGSAGPTTSYRMDPYAPTLIEKGLSGMIGKGDRGQEVIASMKKNGAVYFAAVGGAAALISSCIKSSEIIAYEDLGTEAIRRIKIENFPVTVVIDSQENNLYNTEKLKYRTLDGEQ